MENEVDDEIDDVEMKKESVEDGIVYKHHEKNKTKHTIVKIVISVKKLFCEVSFMVKFMMHYHELDSQQI